MAAVALLAVTAGTASAATFRLPAGFQPTGAALGVGGSVWLASGNFQAPGLALVASDGAVRSFPSGGGTLGGLTATADGGAWFTNERSAIGRITAAGQIS